VLVGEDATRALEQSQAELTSLQRSSRANSARMAALYAVQAQSYSALELDGDARQAALKGLVLAPDPIDPIHIDLLSAHAENTYDHEGIENAVKAIETARASQNPGSLADTCLLITLGRLQFRQDRGDLAVLSLMHAYQASMAPSRKEQRVLAADALSSVMREMGDSTQALALNQEVIDWDVANGQTLNLSVARFLRGTILLKLHEFRAAIDQYTQARELSVQLNDQQGVAFADMNTCEAQIGTGQLAAARQNCDSALSVFTAAQSGDVTKEVRALLAEIDLNQGHEERALATLNDVLAHSGEDIPHRRVPGIYKLRARANAAAHNYRDAYADLDEYVKRYVAAKDAEQIRQAGALRARFATDREIERNASLQRELELERVRSDRQSEQLQWTVLAIIAGTLVTALLTYTLIANLRHKRQLLQLASVDSLTGLPNRRRTAELADEALTAANLAGKPLTIALLDLDHFKTINDRYGHAGGDAVLKEFARASRATLRATDTLGRWGGEEFLLVMPDTTLDTALVSLERLRVVALDIRLPSGGTGPRVTLSAGLATNEGGATSLDDIIARADSALYAAKDDGRDLVRIAHENHPTASTAVRRAMI
jgi:diguanylate cyclase (GGDEF)-like protein